MDSKRFGDSDISLELVWISLSYVTYYNSFSDFFLGEWLKMFLSTIRKDAY